MQIKQPNKFQLILASQSPRRKELLAYTFLPFKIEVADIEEVSSETNPEEIAKDISKQKAQKVFDLSQLDNPIVLGSDTMVCLDDKILGKPKDIQEAKEMLTSLAGRTHDVITGVSIISKHFESHFAVKTQVSFHPLDEELLDLYLQTGESLDKAGSYGIQAWSLGLINEVKGNYSSVVGLPVDRVLIEIKKLVTTYLGTKEGWRSCFE